MKIYYFSIFLVLYITFRLRVHLELIHGAEFCNLTWFENDSCLHVKCHAWYLCFSSMTTVYRLKSNFMIQYDDCEEFEKQFYDMVLLEPLQLFLITGRFFTLVMKHFSSHHTLTKMSLEGTRVKPEGSQKCKDLHKQAPRLASNRMFAAHASTTTRTFYQPALPFLLPLFLVCRSESLSLQQARPRRFKNSNEIEFALTQATN